MALLAAAAPAGAARAPITGKLSKRGYTVIALAANGRATSIRPGTRAFRLRPRADSVTLHLRGPKGKYGGPIVVRATATRAVVGVRAGARLGLISVRRGYARVLRRLPDSSVDASRTARARRGVPIGAGRFGRVRSKPPRVRVPGDLDLDGIPNVLDIDDDGDLVLDNLDHSTAGRGAQAAQACGSGGGSCPEILSVLARDIGGTVNVNAGSTPAQIDAPSSSQAGHLNISILPGDAAELDCGDPNAGLVYCRKNGSTGRAAAGGPGPPFPSCCDPDGDGYGTLTPAQPGDFFLTPGAPSDPKTGDVLIERVTTGGVETQFPATLQYIFATVPALVSYSDEAGNRATVSYPVGPTDPGSGGTFSFPADDGPDADSDVEVTLTWWRPQRMAIASDPPTAQWMDIGHLTYSAGAMNAGPNSCPQSAFSSGRDDPSGDPLIPSATPGAPGLTDPAGDRPSSVGNTFTYTLNLTRCMTAGGLSFNSGDVRLFSFTGSGDKPAFAQQNVSFRRP